MTNMCNVHTLSVCSLNLILAMVVLLHGELVKVISEVIGSCRVRIPIRINWIRGSRAVGGVVGGGSGECGQLPLLVPTIIAGT